VSRVRLVDVAAKVGVSAKSVSNVVNGTGVVSDEVRARILAAIDELGYRPNLAARQLRIGTSGLVGLVMPDLWEPYFAEFASQFFSAAQRRSLTVLVSQTHGERETELALAEGTGLPALEGLVMSPLALTARDVAGRKSTIPLVLIGEHAESLTNDHVPHVGVDNVAAAAAATHLLLDRGRRRIAVIGVQESGSTATSRLRFEGYRRALDEAGVPFDPRLVGTVVDFSRAQGSEAASRLIDDGVQFDGLFCFSDSLAFGALYTLATHNVRVPDEVMVMGFDDVEEGRYSVPRFASVNVNAQYAADLILDMVTGVKPARGGRYVVPFSVVERGAAGAPAPV
jgi:DNA-binding LacI/PurR family transcriptional regulator